MSNIKTLIYEMPTLGLINNGWQLDLLSELELQGKLDHTEVMRVEVALQEAMANSVEHGNLGLKSEWKEEFDEYGVDRFTREKKQRLEDPNFSQRKLKIVVQYSEDSLDISIQDEGEGFIPDTHSASKGVELHGRGLFMIRSNMDEVDFDNSGRIIRMKKRF